MGGKTKNFGFYWDMYKCAVEGMNYVWGDYAVKNLSETNIFKLLNERAGNEIVLFDGGAHEGEYTLNFMNYFKDSDKHISIHAFEPMEKSMAIYKNAVSNMEDIDFHYIPYGLAEEEGTVPIFFNNDTSIIASLYKRQLDYFDIEFSNETDEEVTATVQANLNAMRLWAMQYALHVKVLAPAELEELIHEDLKKSMEKYETR